MHTHFINVYFYISTINLSTYLGIYRATILLLLHIFSFRSFDRATSEKGLLLFFHFLFRSLYTSSNIKLLPSLRAFRSLTLSLHGRSLAPPSHSLAIPSFVSYRFFESQILLALAGELTLLHARVNVRSSSTTLSSSSPASPHVCLTA